MIETVVIKYLSEQMSVPVYGEVPEDFPLTFVTVEKTGSFTENYIVTCTLAIQSWAGTQYEAAQLNAEVKNLMQGLLELDSISKVKCTTDYNFIDTTTKRDRYQAVFDVVYYEEN